MNIIKISAGMPNTVSDITASNPEQKLERANTEHINSKPLDQMRALMNIVKMSSGNPFHTQVIQAIKDQVQRDYYQVDMNSLVSHLHQELSVDGEF